MNVGGVCGVQLCHSSVVLLRCCIILHSEQVLGAGQVPVRQVRQDNAQPSNYTYSCEEQHYRLVCVT